MGTNLEAEGLQCVGKDGKFYYSVEPHAKWKLVVLDAYEISTCGYPQDHAFFKDAIEILRQHCPACLDGKSKDWFAGLPVESHRYVPYNGAASAAQLQWLKATLTSAEADGQSVIITSHIPLYKPATTAKTVLWNAEDVLSILHAHTNVVAVFAG